MWFLSWRLKWSILTRRMQRMSCLLHLRKGERTKLQLICTINPFFVFSSDLKIVCPTCSLGLQSQGENEWRNWWTRHIWMKKGKYEIDFCLGLSNQFILPAYTYIMSFPLKYDDVWSFKKTGWCWFVRKMYEWQFSADVCAEISADILSLG